ncbi:MAG: hypothetical protein HC843_09470 [Sphingomonadales bacterium]|nr:hypothetical protein [Sphingomonadales bacterium]
MSKWIIGDHAKIMRDAKAGVSFASLAPAAAPASPPPPLPPVQAKARECDLSARVHDALRRRLGVSIYDHWLKDAALIYDEPGLTVIVASEFQRSWIEDRYGQLIGYVAREAANKAINWVRVQREDRRP